MHAPGVRGIDAPIAVRMGGVVRVLSSDWRGLGETSLFPNGAPADNTISGGPAITLAWPSGQGAYFTPYLNAAPGSWAAHTWAGSLVEHGAGAAGLLYRRNRYYDPASGRFTQQDPIGLGGGLNVYGFAGGDPVSSAVVERDREIAATVQDPRDHHRARFGSVEDDVRPHRPAHDAGEDLVARPTSARMLGQEMTGRLEGVDEVCRGRRIPLGDVRVDLLDVPDGRRGEDEIGQRPCSERRFRPARTVAKACLPETPWP